MTLTPYGNVKNITSLANPIIKNFKSLFLKKNREKQDLFVVEGLKIIIDALENNWHVNSLIFSSQGELPPKLEEIILRVKKAGGQIISTTPQIIAAISRRDNPQTVIGIFKRKLNTIDKLPTNGTTNYLALDRVKDPGNLGTIIRTCDAVGINDLCLIGDTTDPFSIETVRATMGSIFNINLYKASLEEFLTWHKKYNGRTIGTYLKGSVDFRSIDYSKQPNLLLMGNEQQGLCEQLIDICTDLIIIPQVGRADSLNLAVATALTLYEIRRSDLKLD